MSATLDQDVLDVVLSHLDNARDLAKYASVSRESKELVARSRVYPTAISQIFDGLFVLFERRREPTLALRQAGLGWVVDDRYTFFGTFIHNEYLPTPVYDRTLAQYTATCEQLPRVQARSLCTLVAAFGKLQWLKVLRSHGYDWGDTMRAAAGAGHLDVLIWGKEQGAQWSTGYGFGAGYDFRSTCMDNICVYAAAGGHLDVLIWAHENGAKWDLNFKVCQWACYRAHIPMMAWLVENGCPWDPHSFTSAAARGQVPVMQWLWELGLHEHTEIDDRLDMVYKDVFWRYVERNNFNSKHRRHSRRHPELDEGDVLNVWQWVWNHRDELDDLPDMNYMINGIDKDYSPMVVPTGKLRQWAIDHDFYHQLWEIEHQLWEFEQSSAVFFCGRNM